MTDTPVPDVPRADPTVPEGAETLLEVLEEARREGFAGQFIARDPGDVECTGCHELVNPAALTVSKQRRLEGASDVADQVLVLAATCPRCGHRGVLTLGYGPNASEADLAVLPHIDVTEADPAPPTSE